MNRPANKENLMSLADQIIWGMQTYGARFCFDSFQSRLLWWDDFLGDQLRDEWRTVGTGSALLIDLQTGGIVRLTTGAASGNLRQIDWDGFRTLHVDKEVSIEVRAKLDQTTNFTALIGLRFDDNNLIQFWYNTIEPHTTWHIRTLDGGAQTDADTTIAPDTDYHILRFVCSPTSEVHFYYDDAEVIGSPITTNIPDDAGDFLMPRIMAVTRENLAKSIDIDYIVIRQNR